MNSQGLVYSCAKNSIMRDISRSQLGTSDQTTSDSCVNQGLCPFSTYKLPYLMGQGELSISGAGHHCVKQVPCKWGVLGSTVGTHTENPQAG